jgi:1-acyl-sn-glycerol-3-phosphate acyltransferase
VPILIDVHTRKNHIMTVSDLLNLLRDADPNASVMLLPYGTTEPDAQEVRSAFLGEVSWTRETGVDKGRPYEFLYPGEAHRDLRTDCKHVTYACVSVVLLSADEPALRSVRLC